MPRSALRVAAARLQRTSKTTLLETGSRLPLSALRARLDEESAGSRWLLHPDGVLGRALLLPAGATFTVPLKLSGECFVLGSVDAACRMIGATAAAPSARPWRSQMRPGTSASSGRARCGPRTGAGPAACTSTAGSRPTPPACGSASGWWARCDPCLSRARSGWSRRSSIQARHRCGHPPSDRAPVCRTLAATRSAVDLGPDPSPRPTRAHA